MKMNVSPRVRKRRKSLIKFVRLGKTQNNNISHIAHYIRLPLPHARLVTKSSFSASLAKIDLIVMMRVMTKNKLLPIPEKRTGIIDVRH